MKENSKILSIIAFYFSEFDLDAIKVLGYKNRTQAFKEISILFERENNYLKLRRDEFDALPTSKSHRNGWKNRPPAKDVIELAEYLENYSFEELTEIVKGFIENIQSNDTIEDEEFVFYSNNVFTEEEYENIINAIDSNSDLVMSNKSNKIRKYKKTIINNLKKLYRGKCQICGTNCFQHISIDITEAHHIESFTKTHNNDASNIMIICPNHHRVIHKLKAIFDRDNLEIKYNNGLIEKIILNVHL